MANFFYNRAAKRILAGELLLATDALKVMLLNVGYVANRDHDFVSAGGADDPVDHEAVGAGYVGGFGGAGRKVIAGKAFSEDDPNDRGEMDANDLVWAAIDAGEITAAILIKENTNDADSELVGYIDSGFPKVTNGGDLTLQINAEGLVQLLTT